MRDDDSELDDDKDDIDNWYITAEITVSEPGLGAGSVNPVLELRPPELPTPAEESEFIERVDAMIREAFRSARQQWKIKQGANHGR